MSARRRHLADDGQMRLGLPRSPVIRLHMSPDDELVVDSFAGGGGASLGIRWATGRDPDIAVNHDPEAIAMHQANHPRTHHFCGNVWDVNPTEVCAGHRVGLAWFSPDCTFFSKARGKKPKSKKSRALAWVVVRWARTVKPRVIVLENVEEFSDWGPLDHEDRPIAAKKGLTFRIWLGKLKAAGYEVELRQLRACDFGAPTIRKRLFIIARCDGQPIVWPEPTHGPGLEPYRTAAECIDWSIPTVSIFATREEGRALGVNRPLKPKTMARIGRGVWKYVIGAKEPFIVRLAGGRQNDAAPHPVSEPMRTITAAHRGERALVVPSLIQRSWGERDGQAPRCLDIQQPIGTIVSGGIKHALVSAFLAKHYGDPDRKGGGGIVLGSELEKPMSTVTTCDHQSLVATHMVKLFGTCKDGQPMAEPMPTVRAGGTHLAEVRSFLVKYYGTGTGQSLEAPMGTIRTHDCFGLVNVAGEPYQIVEIGLRMLVARELFNGQGFPPDYKIDVEYKGAPLSGTAQVRMCGNSVSPYMSKAIVAANFRNAKRAAA